MNAYSSCFLAQATPATADPQDIRKSLNSKSTGGNTDIIIILACALALSLVLFIWAFFIRKRPRSARGSFVVERRRKSQDDSDTDPSRRKRRKRRPDHPDNWGRNPTLGETGGLPPSRENDAETDPDTGADSGVPPDGGTRTARPR